MKDTAIVCFGRMNPPTKAHKSMVDFMHTLEGDVKVFLSHSEDKEKNPLPYNKKLYYCKIAFGNSDVVESPARNMYEALTELYIEGYKNIIYVCGSDRANEAQRMIDYNNKPTKAGNILYNFDSIEIAKYGEDRISEDVETNQISASYARKCVKDNDLDTFLQIVPFDTEVGTQLFNDLKSYMGISLTEELLNESQSNIVGYVIINSDKGVSNYKAFSISSTHYGLIMGDDRLSSEWNNINVNKVEIYIGPSCYTYEGNDIVVSTAERHIKFICGNKYVLTGVKGSGRSGSGWTDKVITNYQECITGMILGGIIKDDHIAEFLHDSIDDDLNLTGVFDLGLNTHTTVDDKFKEDWDKFIMSWAKAFQVVYNSVDVFYRSLPEGWTKDEILNSRLLHTAYKDGRFINKKDIYDKSDIYFCLDDSIIDELSSCVDPKIYCSIMFNGVKDHKILGVSLKRPSGYSIRCEYDLPGYGPDTSFDDNPYVEYHYNITGELIRTINLRFKDVYLNPDSKDDYPILEVRSDGDSVNDNKSHFAIQWKFNGQQAWAGKGKIAFEYLFGYEEYEKIKEAAATRNYVKCANIILNNLGFNIDEDETPVRDEHLPIDSNEIKSNLSAFINLSVGFGGKDSAGNRITAPYLKVF